jgi:hypothetical protein
MLNSPVLQFSIGVPLGNPISMLRGEMQLCRVSQNAVWPILAGFDDADSTDDSFSIEKPDLLPGFELVACPASSPVPAKI